jgi:O-acetylhomoserine (thiol)-lyase
MADYGFDTLAVHAGAQPDPATGARITPIYQTSAYVFDSADQAASLFNLQVFGNIYSRIMNPTVAVLEERIAALEGGTAGLAAASGHAAQALVFQTIMEPGAEFISARQLYGGSVNQFTHSFSKYDWRVKFADATDADSFKRQVSDKTRAIFCESIANPGGVISDLEGIARVAESAGVPLIVDNTLATPYLIRPFEWGAHIVVHSATKFLGGHGNSLAGLIVEAGTFDWAKSGKYKTMTDENPSYHGIRFYETFGDFAFCVATRALSLRDLGPCLAPMNAFLVLTGMETLPLRMRRHCDNALAVATWLEADSRVEWVNYAGLETHKQHKAQQKYSPKGAGSVFTFGLKGGFDAGMKLVNNVRIFSHLANIGDTRSLVIHPASTTHRQMDDEARVKAGAGPEVVRLSIGIEDPKDLIADLDQAMAP